MPNLSINGITVHYEDVGKGDTLVFLHAGIADMRMWNTQVEAFRGTHRVIRNDLRGFGETPYGESPFSYMEDVRALLDALKVERAVLVGCSMGGMTALEFALMYPERTRALVLVGSGLHKYEPKAPPPPQFASAQTAREQGDLAAVAEIAVQVFVIGRGRTAEQTPTAIREYVHGCYLLMLERAHDPNQAQWLNPSAAERLSEIAAPTLVIIGSRESEQLTEISDLLAGSIPNALKVMMEGTTHVPNMEFPEQFNAILREFLSDVS